MFAPAFIPFGISRFEALFQCLQLNLKGAQDVRSGLQLTLFLLQAFDGQRQRLPVEFAELVEHRELFEVSQTLVERVQFCLPSGNLIGNRLHTAGESAGLFFQGVDLGLVTPAEHIT